MPQNPLLNRLQRQAARQSLPVSYIEFGWKYNLSGSSLFFTNKNDARISPERELIVAMRWYELVPDNRNGFGVGGGPFAEMLSFLETNCLFGFNPQSTARAVGSFHLHPTLDKRFANVQLSLPNCSDIPAIKNEISQLIINRTKQRGYIILPLDEVKQLKLSMPKITISSALTYCLKFKSLYIQR